MRNRMYGGVRGRKTKVGEKLLCFPPTRLVPLGKPVFGNILEIKDLQSLFALSPTSAPKVIYIALP